MQHCTPSSDVRNRVAESICELIRQSREEDAHRAVASHVIASVRGLAVQPVLAEFCGQLEALAAGEAGLCDSGQISGIMHLESASDLQMLQIVSVQWSRDNSGEGSVEMELPGQHIRVEQSWNSSSDRVMMML